MGSDELTALSADAMSQALHDGSLSCREVMQAHLERIHGVNPRFNAIVSLADDEALLCQAEQRDAELARGRSRGWLHGLPVAVKDTAHAVGFPTTLGSPLLADARPERDSLHVERIKALGAIVVGKTNMSEFGLGSHTFNPLFGTTGNAWNPALSAGGSSGGAAVALAQRLVPLADGSDFMGSLRNPAGWNHVFGLRPSQGRVPGWPRAELWLGQLATDGPMARTVRDLARLLSAMAGHDARAPLSLADAPEGYVPAAGASVRAVRVGWLGDLGGHLAMERGVLDTCLRALGRMQRAGAIVAPIGLGFDAESLWQAWLVWRCALVAPVVAAAMAATPDGRDKVKPEALWEHDRGQSVTAADLHAASVVRSRFHEHILQAFRQVDVLALPSAQVWPFPVEERWPRQVAGRAMDTYHRWMEVGLYASLAGLPAISVPAGFDADGRGPMGLQLIGPPRGDRELLRIAAGYEALIGDLLAQRPPLPA